MERNEKVTTELARQVAASGAVAELESKVAATREDLTRIAQAKSDMQSELTVAQRSLAGVRRDVTEADRDLQTQAQKLSELQTNAADAAAATPDVEPRASVGRSRRGRFSRRGRRSSRSFSVITRSR